MSIDIFVPFLGPRNLDDLVVCVISFSWDIDKWACMYLRMRRFIFRHYDIDRKYGLKGSSGFFDCVIAVVGCVWLLWYEINFWNIFGQWP